MFVEPHTLQEFMQYKFGMWKELVHICLHLPKKRKTYLNEIDNESLRETAGTAFQSNCFQLICVLRTMRMKMHKGKLLKKT